MFGSKQAIMVALGGAFGSIARYKLGGFVLRHALASPFPVSTFCVNLLGCLVIGVLAALVEHHDLFSMETRAFLFTGVLGGFTTFSAFGYESAYLFRRGMTNVSLIYILLSVVGGIACVFLGLKAIDLLWPPRH